ncbi:MAG: hypothetical protein ACOCU6_01490 [Nanoarchaeota archaeon]
MSYHIRKTIYSGNRLTSLEVTHNGEEFYITFGETCELKRLYETSSGFEEEKGIETIARFTLDNREQDNKKPFRTQKHNLISITDKMMEFLDYRL